MLGTHRFVGFVLVTDAARSKHFYCDVLGLRLVHEDGFAIVLDAGDAQLRLSIVPNVAEPAGTNAGWLVDDIHATVRSLAAAGVAFERFPSMDQDPDGVWRPSPDAGGVAWFTDPDGNRLSLTESPRGSQPAAELFQQVESAYQHYTKHARPMAPLVADRVLLKWYSLAVPERAHSTEEIQSAQAFILDEIESGRLALLDEAGFVVQHRVATADVFYVCSWNGNNELWETHYFRQLDTGEFLVGRHGSKFPTFCVWVLAIVHHETQAWSAYLRSARDAASRATWLQDVLDAIVG